MLTRRAVLALRPSSLPRRPATVAACARAYVTANKPSRPPPPPRTSRPPPPPRPAQKAAAQSPPATKAKEPVAQKIDADAPPAGGLRDATQNAQASSENTPPPQEPVSEPAPSQPVEPEPEMPRGPLPDLRQGIPSTFDFEFGGKQQTKSEAADKLKDEQPDLTEGEASQAGGSGGRRSGEDREYSQKDYETSLDRRRALMANYLFLAAIAGAVGAGAYFARPFASSEEVPAGFDSQQSSGWSPASMYARVRGRMGSQLGYYTEPSFPKLLPTVPDNQRQPFTLVLSLEDLMIHTTWDRKNGYRTAKRPGIDYFIRYLSQYYELVLFTSVPIAMADPVIKKLDPYHFIMWPLGREATKYEKGEYLKDLEYLNRDLSKTIIIDTHAPHVKNQPENAIVLPKWKGDPKDPNVKDLVGLIPFLEYVATMGTEDVRTVIKSFEGTAIPEEFARREGLAREKFNAQLAEQRAKAPKRSLGALFGNSLGIKADRAGGMMLGDGQSVAEGLAQGKMLSDQIREQGQKQYEHLETQIREHGAQWLKEEEEEQKKMMEAQVKEMKGSAFSWFGGKKE